MTTLTQPPTSPAVRDLEALVARTVERVYRSGQIEMPGREPRKLTHQVNADEGRMLRDLVAHERPRETLEIGMGTGLSGLHMCWGLLRAGVRDAHHTAIDPFQMSDFWQGAGLALRDQAGLTDMFEWIGQRDDAVLPRWVAEGRKVGLALIDGDHRFEAAMLDFYYIDKLLPVGGVCVFDDADWPSVWRVVQFAQRHRSYAWIDAVPIDQGPLTRPWGWKLRRRRFQTFRRQGWPLWEAIHRKPYQFVALRKTNEQDKPEHFWASLE